MQCVYVVIYMDKGDPEPDVALFEDVEEAKDCCDYLEQKYDVVKLEYVSVKPKARYYQHPMKPTEKAEKTWGKFKEMWGINE